MKDAPMSDYRPQERAEYLVALRGALKAVGLQLTAEQDRWLRVDVVLGR
jgi:hypothetical protein